MRRWVSSAYRLDDLLDVMYGTDEVAIPAETFLNKRLKNMKRVFAQTVPIAMWRAVEMEVIHLMILERWNRRCSKPCHQN
ncbi:hypothetical protein FJT64_019451 [Amphibalanus amphitrite]|uniref:Uncharacterized protein n=1 Tax=Amphibalanus amphitrite TaxID=1232801 RepID=A0A6A4WTS5_AMPAM|nr:hypothetical protein FJT64_019451 [Amphibalanus amphitrite]